jgi:hypothetical protein
MCEIHRCERMGQINLVRAALPHIADKGSFTLISGVLTDEYMHGGTIGTTINHRVEGFREGRCRRAAARRAHQLHQPDRSGRGGRLSRLFHRFHTRAGRGSRVRLSAGDFAPDHRSHSQAA